MRELTQEGTEEEDREEIQLKNKMTEKKERPDRLKLLTFYKEKLNKSRERKLKKIGSEAVEVKSVNSIPTDRLINASEVPDSDIVCFYCGISVDSSCACRHCGLVYICSKVHEEIHRPGDYCFPFIVKRDPRVGRYCIASRDIEPCELILREEAAAAGPYTKTLPVCLQCFKKVDGSYSCERCKFPVCNADCANGNLHKLECDYFVEKSFQFSIKRFDKPNSSYVSITPLRMLLKKKVDPKTFDRINFLMDHIEERTASNNHINMMYLNVAMFLRKTCNMTEFSECDITRVIGILRTNGMKLEQVGSRECPGVALYPIYCLLNHACYNNTNYVKFKDLHLELRAQTKIAAGEEITTRYVSSTLGNFRRRRDISKYWFFHCTCKRCEDTTEMGTNMSAIKCSNCRGGMMLPENSLDYKAQWACNSCTNRWDVNRVAEIMDKHEENVQNVDTSDIDKLEEAIYHYSEKTELHSNHYLVVELCHSLIHKYAALSLIRSLTRPENERKVQLCLQVLDVLSKVDPGFTKWRGTILQEMVSSMMVIAKSDWNKKIITEQMFKKRLYYCMVTLSQARKCQLGGFSKDEQY